MTAGPPHHYPPPGSPPPEEPPAPAYPPPGAPPYGAPEPVAPYPAYPAPGAGPVPPPRPGLPPGMLGAAHKPGAIPLRPLTLGNLYDGAFRIIRFNPKATVGAAVLVTALAMLVPVVITTVLSFTVGVAVDASGAIEEDASTGEVVGLVAAYGSLMLSAVLAQVGLIFVTGMIAHVAHAAAVGRRLGLGEAWAATRGKRWRLLGLTAVINLAWMLGLVAYVALWVPVVALSDGPWPIVAWGLLSVPAFLAASCWFWIRVYYLPAPALMLEPIGVFGAIGRGFRLTSRQFWRTFGIALLTLLIGGIAGSMLSAPVTLVGQLLAIAIPEYALMALVVSQALGLVVQSAFVAPFAGAVTSLQYLDQRMRKEAYDVELMREAGIIVP